MATLITKLLGGDLEKENKSTPESNPPVEVVNQDEGKAVAVKDLKLVKQTQDSTKLAEDRHKSLVQVLKKGFMIDEFEHLRKKGEDALKPKEDSSVIPEVIGGLFAGLRAKLGGSFIGKLANNIDNLLTGAALKTIEALSKVIPAKLSAGLTKIIKIGVGKILFAVTAAFDFAKGFGDEATKKLMGDSSILSKITSGFLHLLSGMTLGIFSPEQIKKGTDRIRDVVGPYLDKIFDHTVKPISEFSGWVGTKVDAVEKRYTEIKDSISQSWDSTVEKLTDFVESIPKAISEFIDSVIDKIPAPLRKAVDWLSDQSKQLANSVKTTAKEIKEQIVEPTKASASAAIEATKETGKQIAKEVRQAPTVGQAVSGSVGAAKSLPERYELAKAMTAAGITDPKERAALMAQVQVESGFKSKSENLNYSAEKLKKMFGHRVTDEQAAQLGSDKSSGKKANQEGIANLIYGGRMGNTEPGDGWKYRGRGMIQLTGKSNYASASKDIYGDDRLVKDPDMVNDPSVSAQIVTWYWQKNKIGQKFEAGGIDAASKMVNAGNTRVDISRIHGADKRRAAYEKFLAEGESATATVKEAKSKPIETVVIKEAKPKPVETAQVQSVQKPVQMAKVEEAKPKFVVSSPPVPKPAVVKETKETSTVVNRPQQSAPASGLSLASIPMITNDRSLALINLGVAV